MTTIELGEVSSGSQPPAPGAPRSFHLPSVRRYGTALLAVLVLLLVTGSAPRPHGPSSLWSIEYPNPMFNVTDDSVYTFTQDDGWSMQSWDLRSGAKRWAVPLPDQANFITPALGGGAVLVPAGREYLTLKGEDDVENSMEVDLDTLAVDDSTGATLWQQRGEVYAVAGDTVLLVRWDYANSRVGDIRLVRVRDGAVVWARSAATAVQITTLGPLDAAPERIVTATKDGRVEVLRLADGAVVTRGRLPWSWPVSPTDDRYTEMSAVAGDTLLVHRVKDGQAVVTPYDVQTLRPRWEVTRRVDEQNCEWTCGSSAYSCGETLICISSNQHTTALDQFDGTEKWRTDSPFVNPIGGGRMLADSPAGDQHMVLSETTGRPVVDMGDDAIAVYDGKGRILRLKRTLDPPGRFSVSALDERTGRFRLLGTMEPVSESGYQLRGDLLVHLSPHGRLVVTDVG